MFDPVLVHSSQLTDFSFMDKLKRWNTANVWLNFVLPIVAIVIVLWFMKMNYDRKQERYHEYVPKQY